MLKRKWIIDNTGCLVGVWVDSNRPSTAPVYRNEHPVLKTVYAAESRNGVGRRWLRYLRIGKIAACLTLAVAYVMLPSTTSGDAGGKIAGTVEDETPRYPPSTRPPERPCQQWAGRANLNFHAIKRQ